MNLFDSITEYLSNIPAMSCIKQWFDGDVSFRYGNFLGSVKLDVAKSEICATLELDDDSFKHYGVALSEVGLLFLANELSANIGNISFFVIPDAGLCMCLKKFFYYSSQDDALKYLQSAISELSIVAEAILRIAAAFEIPNIPDDFYEVIKKELGKATFEHIVQRMDDVRILFVDDFFNPGLKDLKIHLKNQLHNCKIFEAKRNLNPAGMKYSLNHQIQEDKIDLVVSYGNGCFIANQLTNVPNIFISPKFRFAEALKEHIEEYNPEVSSLRYDIETSRRFAIMSAEEMENMQFCNLRFEDVDKTVAFFWTDNCSDKNAELYNMAYGPISELLSEPEIFTDDIIRYKILPAIYALYAKSHRPAYKGNMSRGEFAEHLRSIVQDKISYGTPEIYGERAFVKVCPYTHDISLEHGYREFLLEMLDKDERIVPKEDMIRQIALMRYPDNRVTKFIDKAVALVAPYQHNYQAMQYNAPYDKSQASHRLSEMLLIVHKADLSMEVRFKEDAKDISKDKSVDIYPFSRFAKKDTKIKYIDISYVMLTKIAMKYIKVEGFY